MLVDDALRHNGIALKVLQVRQRNQLIQSPQPKLIFGQHNQVLGLAARLSNTSQLRHCRVDCLERMYAPILQHLEKGAQHISHRGCVIICPVVVEGRQIQVGCYNIQFVLAQLRQQILRQDQSVN